MPIATNTPPHSHAAPSWFRFAMVALAVLVLCSCRSTEPVYRVAEEPQGSAIASAFDAMLDSETISDNGRAPSDVKLASYEETPTYLTDQQIARATAIPADCPIAPCGPGGCACCAAGAVHVPSDEYLCDGGDVNAQAAVVKGGSVVGLDPEDSVAHYDTIDGRTVITPSNKVCIYAPRFAAVRQVVDPRAVARIDAAEGAIRDLSPVRIGENEEAATSLAAIEPNIHRVKAPPSLLRNRQQAGELDRDRRVALTLGAVAAYANLQTIRTGEVIGEDIVKIARSSLAAITWTGNQAAQVLIDNRKAETLVSEQTPGTIYLLVEPNNPKLRLIKLASTNAAQPGDEVEFTLRFDNVGDRVIGNVTILDSLTTRLEYVEGSQKASVEADFATQANEGDSLKLRWEIREPLKPGEGGVIQFRCRVR